MLVSKYTFRIVCLLFLLVTGCSSKKANSFSQTDGSTYVVTSANDPVSRECAYALYTILAGRATDTEKIFRNQSGKDSKEIKVEVMPHLEADYWLEKAGKGWLVRVKNKANCTWLFHQLVQLLSTPECTFYTDDLPPAVMELKAGCRTFEFSYREPYFPSNLTHENHSLFGTHTVEYDWGVWGHNLRKMLNDDTEVSLYARRSDSVCYEQFCFSGEALFSQVKEYIMHHFGEGKESPKHFMIMPDDNSIVCECEKCLRQGNTPRNALPAVSAFIKRLALYFPDHVFFTSAYGTTFFSPQDKWPANTGVIISTIDLPKGGAPEGGAEVQKFIKLIKRWKKSVPVIYVWDYAANFDDYLTPLPVLYGFRQQLAFYRSHGVKGVFLNASGYDYSPFEDVKTFVAAALLMDPGLSVDVLCRLYFERYYPVSGRVLSDYYLSLEKRMEGMDAFYDLYAGFGQALSTYLDIEEFVAFYRQVAAFLETAQGEEKVKLTKLYTALSFTRLQLAYHQKDDRYGFFQTAGDSLAFREELLPVWQQLSAYTQFEDMMNYREADGSIGDYLHNWEKMMKPATANLLTGAKVKNVSQLDENDQDITLLTDGVTGFDRDYHLGWYLNSIDDLHLQFQSPKMKKARQFSMRFLLNSRHRMSLPDKVDLYRDGVFYKTLRPFPEKSKVPYSIGVVRTDVDLTDTDTLGVRIFHRDMAGRSIVACDEILLY